jgi:hypothetical protein
MLREMRPSSCLDVKCNIGRTQRGLNLDRTDLPSELMPATVFAASLTASVAHKPEAKRRADHNIR